MLNREDVIKDTVTAGICEAGSNLPDDINENEFPYSKQLNEAFEQAHQKVTPMYGWICPKCGRVHAPWVNSCPACGPECSGRPSTGSPGSNGYGYTISADGSGNTVVNNTGRPNTTVTQQKVINDYSINFTGTPLNG